MTDTVESYRDISDELDAILAELQAEDVDVDHALELYKKGKKLIKQLETRLSETENKITELKSKQAD